LNNNTNEQPQPGFYRHYKGRYYQVLALVRHSEEDEPYVLYRALYGAFGLWVRPLAMFIESVSIDGEPLPRFAFVSSSMPADLVLPPPLPDAPLWPGLIQS
jgi:hypothetical protein